jgi:hypothetical protein
MCRERFGRGSEWEPLQRKIAAFLFAVQLAQIDDATETAQARVRASVYWKVRF